MRKSVKYLIVGIIATAIVAAIVLLTTFHERPFRAEDILARYQEDVEYGRLTINYPLDETLFPPEIAAPTFHWEDDSSSDMWLISISFQDEKGRMNVLASESRWMPEQEQWQTIKKRSLEKDAGNFRDLFHRIALYIRHSAARRFFQQAYNCDSDCSGV